MNARVAFIASWVVAAIVSASFAILQAQQTRWTAAWTGSVHGPYPIGNAVAQPELKFAFPEPAEGANDQTFRLIVKPDIWGDRLRIRFSNTFGPRPVTFDGIFLGVQASAGNILGGTNQSVTFGGKSQVTVAPGASTFSDTVQVRRPGGRPLSAYHGRKLAVSFHIAGSSGPMTWHAKALQTSYVTAPGAGAHGHENSDTAFPYSTTSWYFLDAVDVMSPADMAVVCAFRDSITDRTGSTLNGDDRWPDVLSQRLHAVYGNRISVVNAGIGGNRVIGPESYLPAERFAGGPSALQRLDRDVLGVSGLTHVIILEGINDISAGSSADDITRGLREIVSRVKAKGSIKVIGTTVTSALNATTRAGNLEADERRKAVNAFIRTSGIFDAVVDLDAATVDPVTGSLREEFQPNSTTGGGGDKLHPNRAGYQSMGNAFDPRLFAPSAATR